MKKNKKELIGDISKIENWKQDVGSQNVIGTIIVEHPVLVNLIRLSEMKRKTLNDKKVEKRIIDYFLNKGISPPPPLIKRIRKKKVKTSTSGNKVIISVEGSNDFELNTLLMSHGVFLKDLVWLSDTRNLNAPITAHSYIGKVFYNPKNKIRDNNTGGYFKMSQREIQELRDVYNPLKNVD